jgi:hypothetical protein
MYADLGKDLNTSDNDTSSNFVANVNNTYIIFVTGVTLSCKYFWTNLSFLMELLVTHGEEDKWKEHEDNTIKPLSLG